MTSDDARDLELVFAHHGGLLPFIEDDLEGLRERFDVTAVSYRGMGDAAELLSAVRGADVVLCWWANWQATLAAALPGGPPVLLFAGGNDVQDAPEIDFGVFHTEGPLMRRAARFGLEHADLVCVGSPHLRSCVEAVAEPRRLELVPYGVPVDEFTPGDAEPRERVLTVAGMDEDSIKRKGIDEFVEVARQMPDVPFDLVGDAQDEAARRLVEEAPDNVVHHGRLTGEPLLERFREAKVYCQLSWLEGFGVSLAEAMACGCVPVVSDRPAHNWVAGDAGWTVPYGEPEAAAEAVREAFEAGPEAGEAARQRVVENFTLPRRIDRLAELLADLARA